MTVRHPLAAAVVLLVLSVTSSPAHAQHRVGVHGGVVVGSRSGVVVGGSYGYYRPYYRPYFYAGFYHPFYYPYYPWGPWPYYGYGYGAYDPTASLRLQVMPRETEVFIDGYFAGTVDDFDGFFQRLHLGPGQHDLQLYLPGHRSVTQKVYLQPGNTFRVKHTMEPLDPGEAEPVRPEAAAPPPPSASSQAPAPRPQRQPRAPAGSSPAPSAREAAYGTLALRVQPGSAEVRIDGERWDGPQGDERLVVQLSAGRHVIDIQKDGYRQYTTEVTVEAGGTSALNVALTRQ